MEDEKFRICVCNIWLESEFATFGLNLILQHLGSNVLVEFEMTMSDKSKPNTTRLPISAAGTTDELELDPFPSSTSWSVCVQVHATQNPIMK